MQEDTQVTMEFTRVGGKSVVADFEGGVVTSDAGLLFLRQTERRVGIVERLARCIPDGRDQRHLDHPLRVLLTQRVMQIACGYEDADDSDALRTDPSLKVACGRAPLSGKPLGSQPTVSRLENAVSRPTLYRIAQGFVDAFIDSYDTPPTKIILDIDDTDDPTHGAQQMALFNAHYDEHCYLPLHIYEGKSGKLVVSVLRPGRRPTGRQVAAILRRVIQRIRRRWPRVKILVRGDSHFSGPEMFDMCRRLGRVRFVLGLSSNRVLAALVEGAVREVEAAYARLGKKLKVFVQFAYQAQSWSHAQRVICKIEVNALGRNVRFIVTDLSRRNAQRIYDEVYCARGAVENYIKNHKTYLHSDRTSCHTFEANQFRLFLHSAAYVLLHALNEKGLRGTELAASQFDTIIRKVVKIGAVVVEHVRQIRFHLPSSCPFKSLYERIHANLACTTS